LPVGIVEVGGGGGCDCGEKSRGWWFGTPLTRRIGVECGVMLPCPPRSGGLLDFAGQANSVGGVKFEPGTGGPATPSDILCSAGS
jgi:hypothetical protein